MCVGGGGAEQLGLDRPKVPPPLRSKLGGGLHASFVSLSILILVRIRQPLLKFSTTNLQLLIHWQLNTVCMKYHNFVYIQCINIFIC